MEVFKSLSDYFKQQGLKQTDIALACGWGKSFVSELLNGKRAIGEETALKLNKVYGFDTHWLLTGEGTMLRTDATSESREEAEMEATDLVRELRRQLEEERRKNEELQKKTDAQQSTINSMAKTMEMMMEEKQKNICG